MKSIRFLLLVLCGCAAISCEKNDDGSKDDPADVLAGTGWQTSLMPTMKHPRK